MIELKALTGMTLSEAFEILCTMSKVYHIEIEKEDRHINGSVIVNYLYRFEIKDGKLLELYEIYDE